MTTIDEWWLVDVDVANLLYIQPSSLAWKILLWQYNNENDTIDLRFQILKYPGLRSINVTCFLGSQGWGWLRTCPGWSWSRCWWIIGTRRVTGGRVSSAHKIQCFLVPVKMVEKNGWKRLKILNRFCCWDSRKYLRGFKIKYAYLRFYYYCN